MDWPTPQAKITPERSRYSLWHVELANSRHFSESCVSMWALFVISLTSKHRGWATGIRPQPAKLLPPPSYTGSWHPRWSPPWAENFGIPRRHFRILSSSWADWQNRLPVLISRPWNSLEPIHESPVNLSSYPATLQPAALSIWRSLPAKAVLTISMSLDTYLVTCPRPQQCNDQISTPNDHNLMGSFLWPNILMIRYHSAHFCGQNVLQD